MMEWAPSKGRIGGKEKSKLLPVRPDIPHSFICITQAVKVYLWSLCKGKQQKNQSWSSYHWNVSWVVREVMHVQVTEKVNKLSGDVGGTQAFLKSYQPGLVHIIKGLSKSEHAKMQSLAMEWEERGALVDVQCRCAGSLIY